MDEIELVEQVMAAILNDEAGAFEHVEIVAGADAGLLPGVAGFVLPFPATGRQFVVTVAERSRHEIGSGAGAM